MPTICQGKLKIRYSKPEQLNQFRLFFNWSLKKCRYNDVSTRPILLLSNVPALAGPCVNTLAQRCVLWRRNEVMGFVSWLSVRLLKFSHPQRH